MRYLYYGLLQQLLWKLWEFHFLFLEQNSPAVILLIFEVVILVIVMMVTYIKIPIWR